MGSEKVVNGQVANGAARRKHAENGFGKRPRRPLSWSAYLIKHQGEAAFGVVATIVLLNLAFPRLRRSYHLSTYQTRLPAQQFTSPLPKFIFLSYLDPTTGRYFKGNDDIYFVAFWAVMWMWLRVAVMRFVWTPVARFVGVVGPRPEQKVLRFAEQGWNFAYLSVFWVLGMRILLTSYPGPILDVPKYWDGYPHDCIPALTKFYYLSQTAYWFQQMICLQIEKHRKDHVQMYTHHVVTTLLVCTSYCTNFTGIGTALHTTMDLADIFLAGAKMQKYVGLSTTCDLTFLLFLASWLYTRHYVFLRIVWNIYARLPVDVGFKWRPSPQEGLFLTRETWLMFLGLLLALQAMLVVWLGMILRVLVKVLKGNEAEDSRSDSEDVESEEEAEVDPRRIHSSHSAADGDAGRWRRSTSTSPASTATSSPRTDDEREDRKDR